MCSVLSASYFFREAQSIAPPRVHVVFSAIMSNVIHRVIGAGSD